MTLFVRLELCICLRRLADLLGLHTVAVTLPLEKEAEKSWVAFVKLLLRNAASKSLDCVITTLEPLLMRR